LISKVALDRATLPTYEQNEKLEERQTALLADSANLRGEPLLRIINRYRSNYI
jgi:hypothetical protein